MQVDFEADSVGTVGVRGKPNLYSVPDSAGLVGVGGDSSGGASRKCGGKGVEPKRQHCGKV